MTPNPYWYENPIMSENYFTAVLKNAKMKPGDFVAQEDVQFCANNVEKLEIKGEGMTIDCYAFEAISDWNQDLLVDRENNSVTRFYAHNDLQVSMIRIYSKSGRLISEQSSANFEVIKEGDILSSHAVYLSLDNQNSVYIHEWGAITSKTSPYNFSNSFRNRLNIRKKTNKKDSKDLKYDNDMSESMFSSSLEYFEWNKISSSDEEGYFCRYYRGNQWIQMSSKNYRGQDGKTRTLPTYSSNFDVMCDDQSFLGSCKVADSSVYKRIDNYQHGETALFDHLENLNNKNLSLVAPICNPYKR